MVGVTCRCQQRTSTIGQCVNRASTGQAGFEHGLGAGEGGGYFRGPKAHAPGGVALAEAGETDHADDQAFGFGKAGDSRVQLLALLSVYEN